MKQKNLSELRETFSSKNSKDIGEKNIALHFPPNNWKYNNTSNKNDELIMRKKIFNLSNRLNVNDINSFNLSNKKEKVKNNFKLFFKQQNNYTNNNDVPNTNDIHHHKKNSLLLIEKNNIQDIKQFIGNNNIIININKNTDSSLKNKKEIKDIRIFSFSNNNKKNTNNIYPIRKNSGEKNQKIIFKSGNKDINYRKYLFNEKVGAFNLKEMKDFNENKNDFKKAIKIHDIKHKGLFYLYNLQNNIYNKNKKIINTNYPSVNTFNYTGKNNNSNITQIPKRDKSQNDKPISLFLKSIDDNKNKKNKYNTLDKKNNFNLNDIFLNRTNRIKGEENIFQNKMKFRKQNCKNKYLKIFTQNDSEHNSMKRLKNINLLTAKNDNFQKKIKLKLIKGMGNNKTEVLLKNKAKDIKKYANILLNGELKNNIKKITDYKESDIESNDFANQISNPNHNNNENIINNRSLNNTSEVSKISTAAKDSKYYMNKSLSLFKFIKDYYSKNKKYPETKINFYLYGRRIGQGAFGKVNLGLNVLTGRVVAIKSFKKTSVEKFKQKIKKIQYETELMKRFNHKNITKILEVFNDEEYMLIIMEYINGGNLFNFVKKRRKLSEKMAKFIFRQIILGIQHIHSKNVVHRDIKLENILIDFNNNVKICDFGIGRVLSSEDELLFDKCGTPMYMAPEIILSNEEKGYNGFPVDIWSSGITLYIMLSGSLPYSLKRKNNKNENLPLNSMKDNNNSYLQEQIVKLKPKEIGSISKEAKDLLKGLLNKNPSNRLTCDEILNHPWLKHGTNMDFLESRYNLFTKAEMTMMSKTYIDYRKGDIEDLKENFTLSNLRNDEIKFEEKNITTKSSILDPFNSCVDNNNSSFDEPALVKEDPFDDFKNVEIKLENDIVLFNNKVKEFNLNFEVNNNQEVDNGMIIKTHTDFSISSDINMSLNSDNTDNNHNENNKYKENGLDIDLNILDEMEKFGYDKKYVLDCIQNNVLCHASTVFYLLKNYRGVE